MSTNKRYGYAGKFLRIDLSNKQSIVEQTPSHLIENFLGGRGIGAYYLSKEVDPQVDAFDPANKIIIAPGPLTGTGIPAGTKTTVVTKSPLTGGITYAAASGSFGSWIRFAGYDFLIIEGKSEKPAWVMIRDNAIEFQSAEGLWGLTTLDTRSELAEIAGKKASTLCIGPAGENRVRFACIIMDKREAGRGGTGAVMGAKNLKAIVCEPEKRKIEVFDKEKLKAIIKRTAKIVNDDASTHQYRHIGTPRSCVSAQKMGMLPTRNWQETQFEGYKNITGEKLAQDFMTGTSSCYQCPVKCEHTYEVKKGPYAGAVAEGLEFETVFAFGPACANKSGESVIMAGKLVDDLGMDSISAGATISFAMECYQKGILTDKDTGGLDLTWGNHEAIIRLVHQIAHREGIGDLLAEGSARAAEKIGKGSDRFSITVKNQELSGWDPRASWGMALSYATANRGGCHTTAAVFSLERSSLSGLYGKLLPRQDITYEPFTFENKAELVKFVQDNRAVVSALGACYFARALDLGHYAEMLSAITSKHYTEADLLLIGERIYNLEKTFNLQAGQNKDCDMLPERFFDEPIESGPTEGIVLPKRQFVECLEEYYTLRGWDLDGVPNTEKLAFLGLNNPITN